MASSKDRGDVSRRTRAVLSLFFSRARPVVPDYDKVGFSLFSHGLLWQLASQTAALLMHEMVAGRTIQGSIRILSIFIRKLESTRCSPGTC